MENKENKALELLSTIERVDVPPFLFTRIQQRIENLSEMRVSKKLAWSLSAGFMLLLLVNIAVLANKKDQEKNINLAESMDLMPHNSFYHE